jgi:hypothetical protein
LIGVNTMLTPEELEIQSLYLHMSENPELSKVLCEYFADGLNQIINELVDNGALEATPEEIIQELIELRDSLRQVSAL